MSCTKIRELNDYESMLAKMTCNVGLNVTLPSSLAADEAVRSAWSRCTADYQFLQGRLCQRPGDVGPLGQRYDFCSVPNDNMDKLFHVCRQSLSRQELEQELQRVGTTKIDMQHGTYFVSCFIDKEPIDGKVAASMVISLCHAVSDGPGALQVAKSFLEHLGNVFQQSPNAAKRAQPLTDLQALILGNDYGAELEARSNACFEGMDAILAALATGNESPQVHGVTLLPLEAMQRLPQDDSVGPSCIDAIHEHICERETEALRSTCRSHDATVQGALTVACLVARLSLLGLSLPCCAAVQVPMNCRSMAGVVSESCLCGSVGLWHTCLWNENDKVYEVAKRATAQLRRASQDEQPKEWLRRLHNALATLPPYSLMESSIGVAPIEAFYDDVCVEEMLFFGGALKSNAPSSAQATMVHAVTFRGKLQLTFNFTYPSVSRGFAERSAISIKAVLVAMATTTHPDSLTLESLLHMLSLASREKV